MELGVALHHLRKLVVACQDVLKLLLDTLRVKLERLFALGLSLGVPAVERPVAKIDGLLGLLESGERAVGLAVVGQVGKNDGGAVEGLGLHESLENLCVTAVYSDGRDVCVAVVHGVETNVLLSAGGILCGALAVRGGVDNEHVHVLARGNDVVHTRVAKIVAPGITANEPLRLVVEQVLVREEFVRLGRTVSAQTRDDLRCELVGLFRLVGGQCPLAEVVQRCVSGERLILSSLLHLRDEALPVLLAGKQRTEAVFRVGLQSGAHTSIFPCEGVGDVQPLAEKLVKNLHVSVLELGLLNSDILLRAGKTRAGALVEADFQVLDGVLRAQVLEDTRQSLGHSRVLDIAELVSNDQRALAIARAAQRHEQVQQNRAPLSRLSLDLLQNSNLLD